MIFILQMKKNETFREAVISPKSESLQAILCVSQLQPPNLHFARRGPPFSQQIIILEPGRNQNSGTSELVLGRSGRKTVSTGTDFDMINCKCSPPQDDKAPAASKLLRIALGQILIKIR